MKPFLPALALSLSVAATAQAIEWTAVGTTGVALSRIAIDPANPRVRHTLGMTLLQAGRYPEGWRFYEAVRDLHPQVTAPLAPFWVDPRLYGGTFGPRGQFDPPLIQ